MNCPTDPLADGEAQTSPVSAAANQTDRFLAMLAHELRSPLSPMRTAVEILGRPQIAEPTKERARHIMARQVVRMGELIDELGDIARLGTGRLRIEPAPLRLADVVDNAIAAARAAIDDKQLVLDVELPPDVVLVADRQRLSQALSRMLAAMARRSEHGRRLLLRAAADPRMVMIGLRDEDADPSVAAGDVTLLATIGCEAAATDAIPDETFSIGLALAERLVAAHGGSLRWWRDDRTGCCELAMRLPRDTAPRG